jgi:hypothetical protein
MLDHGNLSYKHAEDIHSVHNYFIQQVPPGGAVSTHWWINDVKDEHIRTNLENIRNSKDIKDFILKRYPNHDIEPLTTTDEVYMSVSPDKISGSDRILTDCHYDTPYVFVPTGSAHVMRVMVALNHNDSVYTQIKDKISVLSKGDINMIDYFKDYHCVTGKIPEGNHRILLKLHYLVSAKGTSNASKIIIRNMNEIWTRTSRWFQRDSIKPQTPLQHIKKWAVLGSHQLFVHWKITFPLIILMIIYLKFSNK